MRATNRYPPLPGSLFTKLFLTSLECRYRRLLWGLRFILGLVLLGLGLFVLSYGSGWGLAFLAAAAANFFLGYRIYQATQSRSPA